MTACPQLDLTLWFIFMCKLYVIGICVKDTKYASYVNRAIPAPRPYGRGALEQCPQDTGCWNPSPGQPLILADRSLGQGGIVQPEKKMLITSKSQLCKAGCLDTTREAGRARRTFQARERGCWRRERATGQLTNNLEALFTSHHPDQVGDLCQENVLGEKSYRVKIDIYRTVQARARGW